MNRLQQKYNQEIKALLKKELGRTNDFEVPKIKKVVINIGVTEDQHQSKALQSLGDQLAIISGQKPKTTRAHRSISSFHLRANDPIGLMVTLRGDRMYQFLDKLISIVLPRVKDFQGISTTAFDGNGNYSLGLEEQIVFPETEYDKIDTVHGMQINIVTSANNNQEAFTLLKMMGMPFKKEK